MEGQGCLCIEDLIYAFEDVMHSSLDWHKSFLWSYYFSPQYRLALLFVNRWDVFFYKSLVLKLNNCWLVLCKLWHSFIRRGLYLNWSSIQVKAESGLLILVKLWKFTSKGGGVLGDEMNLELKKKNKFPCREPLEVSRNPLQPTALAENPCGFLFLLLWLFFISAIDRWLLWKISQNLMTEMMSCLSV